MTKPRGSAAIRAAQADVAARVTEVRIIMNTDDLGDRYRYDDCHFNANGRDRILDRLVPLMTRQLSDARRQ